MMWYPNGKTPKDKLEYMREYRKKNAERIKQIRRESKARNLPPKKPKKIKPMNTGTMTGTVKFKPAEKKDVYFGKTKEELGFKEVYGKLPTQIELAQWRVGRRQQEAIKNFE